MSALFPADESGKNKFKKFQQRERALKFPVISLKHLPVYVDCADEVELEYPCGDKSKDTKDFSEWSYFKSQCPPQYREKRGRWAKQERRQAGRRGEGSSAASVSSSAAASSAAASEEFQPVKVVSRKSCAGWNPDLLRRLREPLKTDREFLAEAAAKRKQAPRPRKTRAQYLMEQLHPLHERESDVFSQSASTESRLPRPRTPPERISEEELHRRLKEQQEAEFQASLQAMRAPTGGDTEADAAAEG